MSEDQPKPMRRLTRRGMLGVPGAAVAAAPASYGSNGRAAPALLGLGQP